MPIIIARVINGILLNELECALDKDGKLLEFVSKESAIAFLREHGCESWTDSELEDTLIFRKKELAL